MTEREIRNWLGKYFLLITGAIATYILLCRDSILLPITASEGMGALQIIVPVLVGQVTIIFKWFGIPTNTSSDKIIDIPNWVVKGPPILVSFILAITITVTIIGSSGDGYSWAPNGDSFKAVLTFCVSLLNASTIFIVLRFFKVE